MTTKSMAPGRGVSSSPKRASPLDGLDPAHRALLDAALAEADRRALAVYLVGGPVRDWLLGQPLRDLDLLVDAPIASIEAYARRLETAQHPAAHHPRFGTAHLKGDGASLDLAAVRKEHYLRPGALPTVAAGTLEEDLRRRDFTINAMAYPLSRAALEAAPIHTAKRGGRRPDDLVLDLGGGRPDLARGILRVFHPRSFHDDPTRALRAGRLAARLGFRLARGSRNALQGAIEDDAFDTVSGDRLRREFDQLFRDSVLGVDPVRALVALERWGVLHALGAGIVLPRSVRSPLRRLGRAVALPPWPLGDTRVVLTALALWCEGLGPATRRGFLARLSLRDGPRELVENIARRGRAELARCERARGRGALDRELHSHSAEAILALYAKAGAPLRRRIVRWVVEDRVLRVPLNGRDVAALGLEGPAIGSALQALRVAWLDSKIRSREEALAFATEWARHAEQRAKREASKQARKRASRLPSGK